MTQKEAIGLLMTAHGSAETMDALGIAVQALRNAEKYKWHDLRKEPKDLPDDRYVVFAFDGTEYGSAVFYKTGIYHGWATSDQDIDPESIIAWRYIEPFEV